MLTRRSFDTLATRAVLVSLIGITLVHVLSLWFYEHALDRELTLAHETRLAERIISIKRGVMLVATDRREAVAHELSGGPIEAHWSKARGAAPGGPGIERWQGLAGQVAALAPDLATTDIVVGTSSGSDPHIALVSLRLPDDSWINVSLFAAVRPPASGHGTLISTTLMAFGVILLSILIARWLTRPIRAVARAAISLSPDGPISKVPEEGPREVRDLAIAFNEMQARIRELVARRTQSLAAVSHDLRTPLTRLKLRIEDLGEPAVQQAISTDIDEMEQMIDATLSYLKGEETSEPTRPLDLSALLGTIIDNARDAGHNAEIKAPHNVVVDGRLIGLKRAFSNLIGNALRFGSHVAVAAEPAGVFVRVTIDDDGPGIPEDQLVAVLEPFVRLEHSRNRETGGVGLGLTIAKSNIEAHGGTLSLTNRPEGGLRVAVMLPRQAR
jgi:signal transduction histidine kinase